MALSGDVKVPAVALTRKNRQTGKLEIQADWKSGRLEGGLEICESGRLEICAWEARGSSLGSFQEGDQFEGVRIAAGALTRN